MRRGPLAAGAALVIVGLAAAALALGPWFAATSTPSKPALPPATAEVTRTTLVETKTLPGTLGYDDPAPISASGTGTLTWIAPIGSIVQGGEPLFKVDERPVIALHGTVPMYRPLRVGAAGPTEGADVRQLQENMAELGYKGFAEDGTYTSATAEAVASWQSKLGLPATGTVEPGEVVFVPGPIRIADHKARVGDLLGERGMPVLTYTGTTRLVKVGLEVADRSLAVTGREVAITVPGVGRVDGRIERIGTVITSLQEEGAQGGPGSSTADARIEVTVTIADQEPLGSLDASPVDVDFASQERRDVLAVPVAALLALPTGGYGLEVVEGDTTRVVPVETGMFAAGLVEVSGTEIAEGMRVGVPT